MRLIGLIICAFLFAGCTTHKSPKQAPKGEQFMFVTDNEEAAFRAAYDAMSEVRPAIPIVDVGGFVRGYRMTHIFALDRYTTHIRIYRAEGEEKSGQTVRGYYPEDSCGGTLIIRGPNTDRAVYALALKKLEAIGRRAYISELRRVNYSLERDRWRLHAKPSLRDGGSIKLESPDQVKIGKKSAPERLKD